MYPPFDPSKMDPKVLMELTQLIRQLPPEKISRMQTLMHNMMAGFDVRKEMEEFEQSLPPGFREKLMSLVAPLSSGATAPESATPTPSQPQTRSPQMDMRQARLTILRAVANGQMSPDEAERLLFSEG